MPHALRVLLVACGLSASMAMTRAVVADEDLPASFSVEPTLYATGFELAEGPTFNADSDLFVCNYRGNGKIGRISVDGTASIFCDLVFAAPVEDRLTRPSGLAVDRQGRLIVADAGAGRLLRVAADGGAVEILADRYEGRRFSAVNDVAIDAAGNIYFSDSGESSLMSPIGSIYRYDIQTAKVVQLASGFAKPAGLAVPSDGRSLCVAESAQFRILRYDITDEGRLANRRVLIDFPQETHEEIRGGKYEPDGLLFDRAGRLYAAMSTGGIVNVVDSATGKILRQYDAGGDRVTGCSLCNGKLHTTIPSKEAVFRLELGVKGISCEPPEMAPLPDGVPDPMEAVESPSPNDPSIEGPGLETLPYLDEFAPVPLGPDAPALNPEVEQGSTPEEPGIRLAPSGDVAGGEPDEDVAVSPAGQDDVDVNRRPAVQAGEDLEPNGDDEQERSVDTQPGDAQAAADAEAIKRQLHELVEEAINAG